MRFDNVGKCLSYGIVIHQLLITSILDLFQVSTRDSRIQKLAISSAMGKERNVYIGFPPKTHDATHLSFISIPTVDFDHVQEPHLRLVYFDYYDSRSVFVSDYASAFAWRSLPSIERLLEAYEASEFSCTPDPGPFSRLQNALRNFADHYCCKISDVPLVRNHSKCHER
jgi:hypothetical protein